MRPAGTDGEPATVRQVAARAGVSRQTVSNVLNAPERVDPATLARVQQAITDLGYRPNRSARSLKTRRAGMIGYCLPDHFGLSPFMDEFLHALCEGVSRTGQHVLLFTAPQGDAALAVYEDLIAQRAVDSFVLTNTVVDDPRHGWLADRRIPFVSFGRTWPTEGEQPGPWVDVDGHAACAELAAGLHALGHRRIAFVGWQPRTTGAAEDRLSGWRAACERLDLPTGDAVLVRTTEGMAEGAAAARWLLDQDPAPTAIMALSDLLGIGVLRELVRRGLRPGEDVAVTGFDDSPLASAVEPGLTSVRQPIPEIVGTVVELLRTPRENRGVLLPGRVVSRGSAPVSPPGGVRSGR
jgi:DNA-binding LacI/PurR family transcriptional regulator